jgi:hypothetical protein
MVAAVAHWSRLANCSSSEKPTSHHGPVPIPLPQSNTEAINQLFNACPTGERLYTQAEFEKLSAAEQSVVRDKRDAYKSADRFRTLGESGVALHLWDSTEFLPAPWIQKKEQGHSNLDASGGLVDDWGRTGNFPSPLPQGADGLISVYVQGFEHLPSLGGVIYNSTTTTFDAGEAKPNPEPANLLCSYAGDAGDDSRGKYVGTTGCDCYNHLMKPPGPCFGFDAATDDCTAPEWEACRSNCMGCKDFEFGVDDCTGSQWDDCRQVCATCTGCGAATMTPAGFCWGFDSNSEDDREDCVAGDERWGKCAAQCLGCDNRCAEGGDDSIQCAFPPNIQPPKTTGTTFTQALIRDTVSTCQEHYQASSDADCYNEILVDVASWTTRTPIEGRSPRQFRYKALPEYFPDVIWAFAYSKYDPPVANAWPKVDGKLQAYPTKPVPLTQQAPGWARIFTVRAWHNFTQLYPDAQIPLVVLDVLTPISANGLTSPFTEVCAHGADTSDACTTALANAGIESNTDLICDDPSHVPIDKAERGTAKTGIFAECYCPGGGKTLPHFGNTCPGGTSSRPCSDCAAHSVADCISKWSNWCSPFVEGDKCSPGSSPCTNHVQKIKPPCTHCQHPGFPCFKGFLQNGDPLCFRERRGRCLDGTRHCAE